MCRIAVYVAQSPYDQVLFSRVRDEIEFTLENIKGRADPDEVQYYLSLLGLDKLCDCKVTELSGGQLQKLVIACALAAGSKILVLDEPFAHLDPESSCELRRVLELLVELDRTVILIEHRFREVAELIDRGLVEKIVLLDNGRIAGVLCPEEIYRDVRLLKKFNVRLPVNVKIACELGVKVRSFQDFTMVSKIIDLAEPKVDMVNMSDPESEPRVILKSVWAGYRRAGRSIYWILKDINLELKSSRIYAVIGRNGSGKSTLLLTIIGNVPHVKGQVLVCGRSVRGVKSVTGLVSYVPQNPDLTLMYSTVRRELLARAKLWAKSTIEAEQTVINVARRLNIEQLLDRNPHALSRGQRFRVALAAVLVQNTPVVLLDEPTTGQDEECILLLGEVLREEANRGKTILLVSHDLDFIHDYADTVIALKDGQVIAQGSPVEILGDSDIMSKCGLPTCRVAEILHKRGVNIRQRDLIELARRAKCKLVNAA